MIGAATIKLMNLHAALDKTKQLTLQLERMRRGVHGTLAMSISVRVWTLVRQVENSITISVPETLVDGSTLSTGERPEVLGRRGAVRHEQNVRGKEDAVSRSITADFQGEVDENLPAALFSDRVQAVWPIADAILVRHLCLNRVTAYTPACSGRLC